ncbi:FlgD immunoglobulin-like domain containing protein [Bremerella sp. JC817]|uniref:FlgD immunoglobulin-like domain containing protein n=1 Tax=Bremerella sp. JC817 TaxID=3231756 RepID=UPI0034588620
MHLVAPTLCLCLLLTSVSVAEPWTFQGTIGNSGAEGESLVTFAGNEASGFGPVFDAQSTIWERAGEKQLNRYALDGRLLASFPLPGNHDRRFDRITLAGDLLVMKIRDALYVLPVNSVSGTEPTRVLGNVEALAVNAIDGKVAISKKGAGAIVWFNPVSLEETPYLQTDIQTDTLQIDDDGTLYGMHSNQIYAWKDGQLLNGFPKKIDGERPIKVGDYWYSFAWHGTVKRFNEQWEPEPGVVLGGASGSFIGYLPQSVDIENGRGLTHVRGDIFAVSGLDGIVQLLQWNEREQAFLPVRRLGALPSLKGLALDASGNIWTPRGSWRWDANSADAASLGDKVPDVMAQPTVIDGKTLCLLKKHYSYVQLSSGPFFDTNGWSHFETKGIADFDLGENVSGATLIPDGNGLAILFVDTDGNAFQMGVTSSGQPRGKPVPAKITGLSGCTSLAWFQNQLIAGNESKVDVYQRDEQSNWQKLAPLQHGDGTFHVHSDGTTLAISDTAAGTVQTYRSLDAPNGEFTSLDHPTHVAISGNRMIVYESGRQRIVKLVREATEASPDLTVIKLPSDTEIPQNQLPGEADFQSLGRPGGLPLEVALVTDNTGTTLSLRTVEHEDLLLEVGIANAERAYVLTGDQATQNQGHYHIRLPETEWKTIRLAASLTLPTEQERFGFVDSAPLHAAFNANPATWGPFDLTTHHEMVEARKQEIRITFEQPVSGKATIVIEDTDGNRVRNLISGQSFIAGRHTVQWDGLDETGKLVSPGNYHWRGITHPGIAPRYKMNFANGGEPTTASWGPNHSTFRCATSNGERIFFAAPVTEGGWALVALNQDGNFVQGYEHLHGYGIQKDAIAADDQYLYCAQDGFSWGGNKGIDLGSDDWKATWKLTIVRYDIQTGRLVEFPGKQRGIEVDEMEVGPGSAHPDLTDFNLGGLAVHDGKLYVGSRDEGKVLVLDADTGKQVDQINLSGVRHLASGPSLYAATDTGVVRLPDGKRMVDANKMDLTGLTVAANGDILVSDAKRHQIIRFDANGKQLSTLGTPGGAYKGTYDPTRMVNPAGLAFGPDGKLWVTEDRWNPKRIFAWDLTGEPHVVYEKFGMPHYGGDGSGFDPENPRRWIGLGCFWDVDIAAGTARPTSILSLEEGHFGNYEPQCYQFFRQDGRTFVCARGKISLISEVLPDGTLHDLAATAGTHHFGYGCDWDPPQAYIDAFYAKWPEKRAGEKPGRKGEGKPWSQRGMGVLWVDRNGDGKSQAKEFDFSEGEQYGGGAWGHLQNSLTFVMPVSTDDQVSIVTIEPQGFLANGVPNYGSLEAAIAKATPIDLSPGYKRSGVSTIQDRFGRMLLNSDPEMNAYWIDRPGIEPLPASQPKRNGTHLWSFPNQWSDVHGSHHAPLPKPGVMQGTMAYLGVAPLDEESDVVFLNGNHGRCFLLTTDGLYLDEAFVDVRVSYLMNEYRLGGEIFGGSFGRSLSDGTFYVQIGHGPYRIYELEGLGQTKRMKGSLAVTRQQVLAAQQQTLRQASEQQASRNAEFPGKIAWDKDGKFKVEVSAEIVADQMQLTWQVQDRSPWVNNGRDWTKLFATGDSVDFQFATNHEANPKRRDPVPGDKRLLIAPHDGQPLVVLYEHRLPEKQQGNAIEFTSPWRAETVDNVQKLQNANVEVRQSNGGYHVTATVPLKDLGFDPQPGIAYRGDFGVTYGNAEGTDTNLRSYWSNGSTGLVDDIPGEIMLSPGLWGTINFRAAAESDKP